MTARRTAAAALVALSTAAAAPSVGSLRDARRVLILSAPGPADAALRRQDRELAAWRDAAADRDVSIVRITGTTVAGAADHAPDLRHRYRLPADAFALVLLGKDGHVALRTDHPVSAAALSATIDAMPMRRAGLR